MGNLTFNKNYIHHTILDTVSKEYVDNNINTDSDLMRFLKLRRRALKIKKILERNEQK